MGKRPTLFYSWQSDHSKTRSYIENALKTALENVAKEINIEDAPRLDKDTQGEVGAVSITATIKRKITASKIFLADVSLIDEGKMGRKLANQNVMFELGYAFGKKGEKAVMLVANSDFGDAKELPFDIAQNRIIFFSPKNDPKAQKLTPNLEGAIRAHLSLIGEEETTAEQEDAKEQLISAIENSKPTLTKAELFIDGLYTRYLELAPTPSKGGEQYVALGERTFDAYQKTLPLTIELFGIINTAAEYGDMRPIQVAYKELGRIAARYDQHGADEYAALTIQEIASIIIGCLAKFEHWNEIGLLIEMAFSKPTGGMRKYKIDNTYQYLHGTRQFFNKKTGVNYVIPTTPLIQERFVDNDKVLQAYTSGALLLMLALEFYYPYTSGLLLSDDSAYVPEYMTRLGSEQFAQAFKHALGASTLNELREKLEQKRQQPLSDGFAYRNRDITHIFSDNDMLPIAEKIGTK